MDLIHDMSHRTANLMSLHHQNQHRNFDSNLLRCSRSIRIQDDDFFAIIDPVNEIMHLNLIFTRINIQMKNFRVTHRGKRICVTINIEYRNYHPVKVLSQIHDGRIFGSEQFIQKIGCGSHCNPFTGVNC